MDMQHKLDMRKKELYLKEKYELWVGSELTTLCWESENIRSCYSVVTKFKAVIFLMLL